GCTLSLLSIMTADAFQDGSSVNTRSQSASSETRSACSNDLIVSGDFAPSTTASERSRAVTSYDWSRMTIVAGVKRIIGSEQSPDRMSLNRSCRDSDDPQYF